MALVTHDDLLVCTDCVQLIANAEGTTDLAERVARRWPDAHLVLAGDLDTEAEFSHRTCDGCGDTLAGDRFPAAGLETNCALFKRLDRAFGTDTRSPLHHDNRCTACRR